jgi:hypothetical protein
MTPNCPSFKAAFLKNMAALHLPAPDSLWTTATTAISNVSAMLTAISKLSADATLAEIAGATTGLELLGAAGAFMAAGYTGACIGSLIVAADASMVCTSGGEALATVSEWGRKNGILVPPAILVQLQRDPAPLMPGSPYQPGYARRIAATSSRKAA